jgi:hypothetical protein
MTNKPPDLQEWVARYGGYQQIPWDEWDQAVADYQAQRRLALPQPSKAAALPSPHRCHCGGFGYFGYRNPDNSMTWYCAAHRRAQWWADAHVDHDSNQQQQRAAS